MRPTVLLHVLGGAVGLLTGFVALYAAKGATLHRRSGIVFVGAMLWMCAFALLAMAVYRSWYVVNVLAAVLTSYLVVTGLTAVRAPTPAIRRLEHALTPLAALVGVAGIALGVAAIRNGGKLQGIPAYPYLMFGGVGLLGSALDVRRMRTGPLRGARRLARHLWRMCFALFVGAMSFFLGQADVIPKPIRIMPLLAVPPLAVLVTMLWWLWRVRRRRVGVPAAPLRAFGGEVASRG
ncbi:hypothetical protein [Roseisolibacter agri]|uniref:DUF2306 domain-containing protein n=1 Tax=Roseisolibacter agri TaxID=2014610 RepID=A0AA37QFE2_9BACT|nr:hypothetical protein [Roseisolibacter agri]GLC27861.1 hypothetical protein rosag_43740 [Roseisolibacter agri]